MCTTSPCPTDAVTAHGVSGWSVCTSRFILPRGCSICRSAWGWETQQRRQHRRSRRHWGLGSRQMHPRLAHSSARCHDLRGTPSSRGRTSRTTTATAWRASLPSRRPLCSSPCPIPRPPLLEPAYGQVLLVYTCGTVPGNSNISLFFHRILNPFRAILVVRPE